MIAHCPVTHDVGGVLPGLELVARVGLVVDRVQVLCVEVVARDHFAYAHRLHALVRPTVVLAKIPGIT